MADEKRPEGRQFGDGSQTEVDSVTVDAPSLEGSLVSGAEIGGRYRIVSRVGAGGMGEVWRAFDLKLRVEVALKAVRKDVVTSERHLEALRQEVRAAREVVSPNVCRIYDLEEIDGRELVSMEFVDGQTLLDVLKKRGPLELAEGQDIASQFLAGLEAIHKAGFIHRDVKPENIMVTRAGRVVVMDFGLARHETDPSRSASGTPAYMAPEQVRGEVVDARADVYAAGVVLAEMVSPGGVKDPDSRKSLWEGVRSDPPKLPESPWAPVLRKAVAKAPGQRYHTAHTLTRALEEVTLRVAGAEDLTPYPGLASFTEADAEYFFGREAEIEAVWRRLQGAHLLALVGPSGAGKTSFIGAGLLPNAPAGWAIVRCTPGNAALSSLARAMAREMAGDADALELVVGMEDPEVAIELFSRWRERHDQVLLIVDQFEELFTQNTDEEQRSFAALMGLLPLRSDVRVLLSMRDDFLMLCNRHEALRPVFSELTPLDPPVGAALRRALVQPATRCGYHFEDDELVEEVLTEVEGERGALPLLAFAMARLWEKRDRDSGLLTRTAFHDIGGVGGALARHAEQTIDRIGSERVPTVRELFRNLVTAEGTRAVREVDELLSVFDEGDQGAAVEVLGELIDARLLTSYEVQEEDSEPTRRVEIIHESLLANWPRLVRWQTQDQEGAQLRDELRQAAHSWDEHGRYDDRLWSGTAYREFRLWQERYPGGLTEVETAFAESMTSLAGRRRRRRRFAAAAALIVFASVAAVFAGLWRRSVLQERRAEAANLVSLGQLELDSYPSATVAYMIASLELADGPGGREMAQQALWKGPTAFVVNDESSWQAEFTPDGRSLVQAGDGTGHLRVIHAGGTGELLEHQHEAVRINVGMALQSDVFFSFGWLPKSLPFLGLWSAAAGRLLGEAGYESPVEFLGGAVSQSRQRLVYLVIEGDRIHVDTISFDGEHERLGTLSTPVKDESGRWTGGAWLDQRDGERIAVSDDNEVYVIEIGDRDLAAPRLLGRHEKRVTSALFDALGRFLATADRDGLIRLWDLTDGSPAVTLQGPDRFHSLDETADGSLLIATKVVDKRLKSWAWSLDTDPPRLLRPFVLGQSGIGWAMFDGPGRRAIQSGPDDKIRFWPMAAPADADPVVLKRGEVRVQWRWSSHPQGQWLASADQAGAALWPLARAYPSVIRRHEKRVRDVVFGPEGRWLVSSSMDHTVRLWPLEGDVPLPGRILLEDSGKQMYNVARTSDGQQLLIGTGWSGVRSVSVAGEELHNVPDFGRWAALGVAISPDGRLAEAVRDVGTPEIRIVVWNTASGEVVRELPLDDRMTLDAQFTDDGHLLSAGELGLRRWNLGTGESELLFEGSIGGISASGDGGQVLMVEKTGMGSNAPRSAVRLDLNTGESLPLGTHGTRITTIALDPRGTVVVTGDSEGVVRVGLVTGEEPHLLLGHENSVTALAIDPLGRWVASGSEDTTVRIWPMPDLSKPPLHTLPRSELIAKLKSLTNLRVVRDTDSATGWTLTHDPFPGWETVPTW